MVPFASLIEVRIAYAVKRPVQIPQAEIREYSAACIVEKNQWSGQIVRSQSRLDLARVLFHVDQQIRYSAGLWQYTGSKAWPSYHHLIFRVSIHILALRVSISVGNSNSGTGCSPTPWCLLGSRLRCRRKETEGSAS